MRLIEDIRAERTLSIDCSTVSYCLCEKPKNRTRHPTRGGIIVAEHEGSF